MLRLGLFNEWSLGALLALALGLGVPAVGSAAAAKTQAVASEHPLATRAALDVLARGGNAVDAVVSAALVAGVVSPTSSGLGGGGFALVLPAGAAEPSAFDFRECAPRAIDAARFERRPLPFEERGELVGVPGEARGLFELVRRYGKKPFAALVAPAIQHARRGFAAGKHLARTLQGGAAGELARDSSLAQVYFPGGHAALEGRLLKNPKLANTLTRLAAQGPNALYEGPIADDLVSAVKSAGGKLDKADLADYRVIERKPLARDFAGYRVFTMPPPSAGGFLLAKTLGLFSREELASLGLDTAAYQHLLAEAFRSALADRFRSIGDPAFVPSDVAPLLAEARLRSERGKLSLERTHSLPELIADEHGTHHLVVADASGMVVSLTTTVNRVFGAKLVAPESGIVLNDELDDFGSERDARALGLRELPNRARAGARPVSSMTPTIVLHEGKAVAAIGGSGGMAIATNVTQLLVSRLVFGTAPGELVKARRFYVPITGGTTVALEDMTAGLVAELTAHGERVAQASAFATAVQVIARDTASGWQAAADPRKYGSAITR